MRRGFLLVASVALLAAACTRTVVVVVTPSPTTPSPSIVTSPPPGSRFVQARGVTFAVPQAWHFIGEGGPTGQATLELAYSPDDDSFVSLQRFGVLINVTPERLDEVKPQLVQLLRDTTQQVGGAILQPLRPAETAGFPGFSATLSITTPKGNPAEELLYIFFDQTNEYTLACAYTPDTREEVAAACEVARQTFSARPPLPPL